MVGFFQWEGSPSNQDRRTLIEATPEGWWYSATLPGHRLVAAYLTDSDLLMAGRNRENARWEALKRLAPYTSRRLEEVCLAEGPHIVSARSALSSQVVGNHWLAVGDAACSFDPLSSQGICQALESGIAAAEAILDLRCGRTKAMSQYADRTARRFHDYLRTRVYYYSRERRWAESVFWQRRAGAPHHTIPVVGLTGGG